MPPEVNEGGVCSIARVKRDWTMAQCIRFAKKKALSSFFEHMHIDTLRKSIAPGPGRHRVARLQQSVLWIGSVGRTLERALGHTWWWSLLLLHSSRFMRLRGCSFKKPKGELGKRSKDTDTPRTVQQKIERTLNDAAITDRSRIINIDETGCKMLPLFGRG